MRAWWYPARRSLARSSWPGLTALPGAGSSALFPVRRIYCVGRNYVEHIREMKEGDERDPPFFFQKNPDNIVIDGKFPYPPPTQNLHFELELVVGLKSGGANMGPTVPIRV